MASPTYRTPRGRETGSGGRRNFAMTAPVGLPGLQHYGEPMIVAGIHSADIAGKRVSKQNPGQ